MNKLNSRSLSARRSASKTELFKPVHLHEKLWAVAFGVIAMVVFVIVVMTNIQPTPAGTSSENRRAKPIKSTSISSRSTPAVTSQSEIAQITQPSTQSSATTPVASPLQTSQATNNSTAVTIQTNPVQSKSTIEQTKSIGLIKDTVSGVKATLQSTGLFH